MDIGQVPLQKKKKKKKKKKAYLQAPRSYANTQVCVYNIFKGDLFSYTNSMSGNQRWLYSSWSIKS